jgi:hypothetical protein
MTERHEAALLVLVLQLGAEALLVKGEDAEHTPADSDELVLAAGSCAQAGAPPWRMDLERENQVSSGVKGSVIANCSTAGP